MTDSSKSSRPLAILTLDGGGVQAVSMLLILNRVLEKIAEERNAARKPRPCDVFDTIAGIGVGGWLAILLGRFRLDITTCLSEWFTMMDHIEPRSRRDRIRLRALQHRRLDITRLLNYLDSLTYFQGSGEHLFEDDLQGARTRHVFVAAMTADAGGYNLFRSYEIPTSAKLPEMLLEGPEDPDKFKTSHAFAVTGAAKYFTTKDFNTKCSTAKYFTAPWEEQMAITGKTEFNDTKFPEPHNITRLALNEMYGIYGTDVPLSVVVNIGPGLPTRADVKDIKKGVRWLFSRYKTDQTTPMSEARSPVVSSSQSDSMDQDIKRPSDHSSDDTTERNSTTDPVMKGKPNHPVTQTLDAEAIKAQENDAKLKRLQDDIDNDIKERLDHVHPGSADLYYRIAPEKAPPGTPQNDDYTINVIHDATWDYLREPRVDATIKQLAKRMVESGLTY